MKTTTPKNPHPEVTASVMYISPELAAELLEANAKNQRSVKRTNLVRIENGFRKDAYVLNGQSIIRSREKWIMDGQHRLSAAVNTRVGFWTVFVDNVPDEYFTTIDCGRSRSFADVLKIRGEDNTAILSSTAQLLGEYMKSARSVGSGLTLSHSELNDVVGQAPTLVDSVRFCKRALCGLAPVSCAAWLHWVAVDGGCGERFEEFLTSLGTGAMLATDSPIFHLRRRLENNRNNKSKIDRRELIALIVKAWNAWAAGASMKALKWQFSEDFPEPIVVKVAA